MYPNLDNDSEEKITNFDKLVKRSGSNVIFLAQFTGFCPFSVDPKNKLRFKFISIPFFMLVFQTLITSGWWFYFMSIDIQSKSNDIFATDQSGTDKLSHILSSMFTIFSQVSNRILTLIHAKDIVTFTGKLVSIYSEVYESCVKISKARFEQKLRRIMWKMNFVTALVLLVSVQHIYGYWKYVETQTRAYEILPPYEAFIFKISFITSNINSLLMIAKALLYVHTLDLISIGFSELNHKTSRNVFLKQYAAFEGLVRNFNSMFSMELTITTTSLGVFLLNSIYTGCVDVKYQVLSNLQIPIEEITVHGMAIFLLCSSATQITLQVR